MAREWYKKGRALIGEIGREQPRFGEVAAWYIGQVGYIFKGTKTVAVDPFLDEMPQRLYRPPFTGGEFQPDIVLCTHGHCDHMAVPTLTAMAAASEKTRFFVPGAWTDTLADAGIPSERLIAMAAGQKIEADGVSVLPVQAAHPVHETDSRGRDTALCLEIKMNGVTLLHMGDTYLTDQLLADLKKLDHPDAFFPPINGGDYFRTARNCIGNLDARESAHLACILKARLSVPTHFDLMAGNTCEPFEFIRLLWAEDPSARVMLPALGERFRIEADPASRFALRPAQPEEAEAVARLYADAVGRPGCTWNEFYPTLEEAEADRKAGCLYVYGTDTEIAGAISIIPENELDGLALWKQKDGAREIARIVIAREHEGCGLAGRMTAQLIELIRQQGCKAVHLLAATCNPAAVKTYEKLGFIYLGEVEMYESRYFAGELLL